MAVDGFKRKLTAILSADPFEYSRLMCEDDEATDRNLMTSREVFTNLIIQQPNSNALDSPDDIFLAGFISPVDAIEYSLEIQKGLKTRNESK